VRLNAFLDLGHGYRSVFGGFDRAGCPGELRVMADMPRTPHPKESRAFISAIRARGITRSAVETKAYDLQT